MSRGIGSQSLIPFHVTRTMVWVGLFAYGFFLVGTVTYQNVRMNQEIAFQKSKIIELEKKQKVLQLSLIYYKSHAYQEIEARRRLGLKGKDERVVSLPQANTEPSLSIAAVFDQFTARPQQRIEPYKAWLNLFFHK
jgi:cell division protein FtsB